MRKSPIMRKIEEEFSGDYQVYRVVMASSDPMETLHNFMNDKYTYIELQAMIEMLDVKSAIESDRDGDNK